MQARVARQMHCEHDHTLIIQTCSSASKPQKTMCTSQYLVLHHSSLHQMQVAAHRPHCGPGARIVRKESVCKGGPVCFVLLLRDLTHSVTECKIQAQAMADRTTQQCWLLRRHHCRICCTSLPSSVTVTHRTGLRSVVPLWQQEADPGNPEAGSAAVRQ